MCALVLGEHGVRVEGGGAVRAAARAHAVVAVAVREQRRARAVARRAARALEAPRALVRHHVPRELTPMTRFVFFFLLLRPIPECFPSLDKSSQT